MILINTRLSYVHHLSGDNMRAYRLFRHILFISVHLCCVCMCVCVFVQECLCLHCIMNSLSIIPATDNQTFLNRRQMCHNNMPFSQSDSEAVGIVARFHFLIFFISLADCRRMGSIYFHRNAPCNTCQTDTKHGYLVQWNWNGCRAEGSQQNVIQNRPLHVAGTTYHHCHVFVVNIWFKRNAFADRG